MKYVQPVGGLANDPYVDANPVGGIEGSAVPAASIEHPMRELVALITSAGLTPTDADLTQVAAAIKTIFQKAAPVSAAASGTIDAITANYTPAIAALVDNMRLIVRASGANTSTTPTFTPASATIAAKTIIKGHNQALAAGDISGAGFRAELQYDVTLDKWVLLNPATGVSSSTPGSFAGIASSNVSATISLNEMGKMYAFYGSTPGQTLTLPAVATVSQGKNAIIVNQASVAVTVKGNAAENISSNTAGSGQTLSNTIILNPGDSIILSSNGASQWNAYGFASPGQFPNSLGTSGYQKFPNGLIIQWGTYAGGANNPTITWPITFPNALIEAFATHQTTGSMAIVYPNTLTTSNGKFSQLNTTNGSTYTVGFFWLSIGY